MKKLALFCLLLVLPACENTDLQLAAESGVEAVKAVTLSDAEVQTLAREAARELDRRHQLAPEGNPHAKRLARLAAAHRQENGRMFNFRVYLAPEVNALALADGTIRFYSGLMETMDDEELRFIIGHEMGHIVEKHLHRKIMLAYAGSALRKGIASQENIVGDLARSSLGGFVEQLVNSRFSQQEEKAADDYGLEFLRREGYETGAAVTALGKLAGSGVDRSFLATHPVPDLRAERLRTRLTSPAEPSADQGLGDAAREFLQTMRGWLAILPEKSGEIWNLVRGAV